eukprot:snap_masked-scaffold_6-processed-gene-0.17-mRNA-1 protein AED:1.00 eAED:1.00 QI:0/0/0/0/1/1/2/0/76
MCESNSKGLKESFSRESKFFNREDFYKTGKSIGFVDILIENVSFSNWKPLLKYFLTILRNMADLVEYPLNKVNVMK